MRGGFLVSRQVLVLGEGVEGAGKGFRFSSGRSRKGTARAESERGLKPKNLLGAESWPNAEILAGKGSGYKPPAAALRKRSVGRGFVSRQGHG